MPKIREDFPSMTTPIIIERAVLLAQKFIHRRYDSEPISPSTEETLTMARAIFLMSQHSGFVSLSELSAKSDDPIDGPRDVPSVANERQVAGTHYGLSAFQHWDMVALFQLDYFQGQITKYVMRWDKKNGVDDLKKAQHFLEKYIEVVSKKHS